MTKYLVAFFGALVMCAAFAQSSGPELTDAQKLKIRNAQVEFFTAKSNLEQTPQFQQMNTAQAKLNDVVQEVMKEAKLSQSDFQLQNDLTLKDIRPPKPEEKPPVKK